MKVNENVLIGRTLAHVDDVVDYPAACFFLVHADDAIPLPQGTPFAVERKPYRGHRMFSRHQAGYDARNDEAYAFALPSSLSDSHREKEDNIVLRFGQLVEVAGRTYRVEDDWNRNVKLVEAN